MSKRINIFLLLLLLSCGRYESKPTSAPLTLQDLQSKSELYLSLVSSHQNADGFILSDDCDSTFFSGLLAAAAPKLNINILAARNKSGQYFRRSTQDCGPAFNNSRSTISRDQMLGVMWYMWRNQDLEAAKQLMNQLQHDNYVLKGEGTAGELIFIPSYINTLAQIIAKLDGPRHEAELALPAIISGGEGFEAHLAALHILLRGELLGSIPDYHFNILQDLANTNPKNPLLQAAYHRYLDGNYESVLQLLMDSSEWPSDKLPTSHNHCSNWPVQRIYDEQNWGSCEPEVEHSGAELPIIYYLVIVGAGDVK